MPDPDFIPADPDFIPAEPSSPQLSIGQSGGAPGIPPTGTLPGNPNPGMWDRFLTAAGAATVNMIPSPSQMGSMGPQGAPAQAQTPFSLDNELSTAANKAVAVGKGLASPVTRALSGDVAGGAGEALPAIASFLLARRAAGVAPTSEQTAARLLNASGDVSAGTAANLKTVQPILDAAKAAGSAPSNMGEAAQLFKNSSLAIERQMSTLVQQNAGVNVSAATQNIANSIRQEALEITNLRPSKASSMWDYADKIENIRTLSELDKERELLNGELQTYMKKGGLDRDTLLRDPVKGFKARALENIRDGIANTLSNPLYSPNDLRVLRAQQSALMKLGDVFEKASGQAQAEELARKGLSGPQQLFQTGAKLTNLVFNPKQAAAAAINNPTSAEQFVKAAFRSQASNLAAGSLVSSVLAAKKPKQQ